MHTKSRFTIILSAALLVVALLAIGGGTASAAPLPPSTACTAPGTGTVTCELWAKTGGTLSLPGGATVNVWGYADSAIGAPQVPGPVLIANQGDIVTVILHNDLGEATSIAFEGQSLPFDNTGATPLGTRTYTVTASSPGTFLYEAGPLAGAQHQVAMGLYGALVVRPTAIPPVGFNGQAFADPATAFHDEALVVLSEIDPALNGTPAAPGNPAAFDMRNYKPKFRLINGKAYPQTDVIATAAGSTVLLRYVNAGQEPHTMALLGAYQKFLSLAGAELPQYRTLTSELLAPGQSADALVVVPPIPVGAPPTVRYPLYDASMRLYNDGAAGFGGMLTFLAVPNGPAGGDATGPATSALALNPPKTGGTTPVPVILSATISDGATGNSNVVKAEYFVGAAGANDAGCAMTGVFGTPTVSASVTIPTSGATTPCVDLATLPHGNHTFYVHGQDAAGNWGSFNFVVLNLDEAGPMTSAISLNPAVSNGSVAVAILATGDDSMSGGSVVTGADYTVVGSTIAGMLTPNQVGATVSLTGTISAGNMGTLAGGAHTLSIMSYDELGNMGMAATTTVLVDKTGPVASGVNAYPNPNNGTLGVNPVTPSVRVDAKLDDTVIGDPMTTPQKVVAAEGFIDRADQPGNQDPGLGNGFPFTPLDGVFNSVSESAYAFIPLTTINALPAGTHTIWVRGKDAAGNWGVAVSTPLTIDKTKPVVSGVSASPNPTNVANSNNTSFILTASATDAGTGGSNIARAEWFEGADPGAGNATAMAASDGAFDSPTEGLTASINFVTLGWAAGNHTVYVRARDAAGNWSLTGNVTINVVLPNAIFSDGFELGLAPPWTSFTGANVSRTAAALRTGSFGMQVAVAGNTPGYVTDGTPVLDPNYRARFYFNPRGLTGNNAQEVIFAGLNAANQTIFQVQYRRQNAGGGTYQVRAGALSNGANTFTGWVNITNNAFNRIEIQWASGNPASFRLWVGGAPVGTPTATLNGLNTSAYKLDAVRLGPSVGLGAGTTGTPYFDDFVSTRTTYIGP